MNSLTLSTTDARELHQTGAPVRLERMEPQPDLKLGWSIGREAICWARFPGDDDWAETSVPHAPGSVVAGGMETRMCKHGDEVILRVPVMAEDSHTDEPRWAEKAVDRCIAPIIQALNDAGILTRSCCCGHGREPGIILLQDGRSLVVQEDAGRAALGGTNEP